MASGRSTKTFGDHVRDRVRKRHEYREKRRLEEGIREVHRRLHRNEYDQAVAVLFDQVIDPLGLTRSKLPRLRKDLVERDFAFAYFATADLLERETEYRRFFSNGDARVDARSATSSRVLGAETSVETARKRVRDAVLTIENIAIAKGLIREELRNSARIDGYELPIGVVWKDPTYDLPNVVEIYDPDDDVGATAVQGAPGKGKSATIASFAEDRYAAGHKVIDCLDWQKAENIFYDVSMRQDVLREAREEHADHDDDVPLWWDEIDGVDEPKVEILMPLTPELASREIPYDTEDERYVVRPFTIPASEIEKRALKAFMTHTTTVGSSVLERAFKEVQDIADWGLADLAVAIENVADDQNVARRLVTNLTTLQKSSFVRDRKDDFALDWEEIFRSTETIHAITVEHMTDRAEKLMVMLYVVNSIRRERSDIYDLPRLTTLWRELNLIAPPDSKKTKDARLRELEGASIDDWVEFTKLFRHDDIEIVADTQEFERQVNSDVRSKFGKGITFRHKKPHIREFWKAYGADYQEKYIRRVSTQFESGDFAYLGESNVDERTFHSPCYLIPPMSHHFDNKSEDHGFLSRVKYLDREELRPAPWSADLPDRFSIDRAVDDDKPTRDEPVEYFAYHLIDVDDVGSQEWEPTDHVYAAFRGFCRDQGLEIYNKTVFGTRLSEALPPESYDKRDKQVSGDRFAAYFGIRLRPKARSYRDDEGVSGPKAEENQ